MDKYIRSGKIIPDEGVFITPRKRKNYFKKETVIKYAEKYGWTLITEENIKKLFMNFVKKMDMSYKQILTICDDKLTEYYSKITS